MTTSPPPHTVHEPDTAAEPGPPADASGAPSGHSQPAEPPLPSTAVQWWRSGDHPGDAVGSPLQDGSGVSIEGKVVRYFRSPDLPGDTRHETCGRRWHDHGWIDSGGAGQTVCPGDVVITAADGRHTVLSPDGMRRLQTQLDCVDRLARGALGDLTADTTVEDSAEPGGVADLHEGAWGWSPAYGSVKALLEVFTCAVDTTLEMTLHVKVLMANPGWDDSQVEAEVRRLVDLMGGEQS